MDNDKRNELEIQKMNKFLKCFTCKTEEEVKQCFDECGFWKTEDEMRDLSCILYYDKEIKTETIYWKKKLFMEKNYFIVSYT